jgi:hypothetical protein
VYESIRQGLPFRKRSQTAAIATRVEDVLPSDGSVNQYRVPKFDTHQGGRADKNGISRYQQNKLDKLARQAPQLLAEVQAGRMSVNAAFIEDEIGRIRKRSQTAAIATKTEVANLAT